MKIREIEILHPEELACELTQTIAAQVFAVCALDNTPIDAGIRGMSVHIKPSELLSSLDALELLIGRLTQQNSHMTHLLSKHTILSLNRLNVLVRTIKAYTFIRTNQDAWVENDGDDNDDD